VETLTVEGSAGQVDLTGYAFASAFGLDSNWFSVTSVGLTLQLVGDRVLDSAGDVLDAGAAAYHGSLSGYKLTTPLVDMAATPDGGGYWLIGSGGQVSGLGDAKAYGMAVVPGRVYVAIASTPDGKGYWMATAGGGVYSFGDATPHGSLQGQPLTSPITAFAATPDGGGYWLVSAAGHVYSFGDAHVYGSTSSLHLARPIAGITPTADGLGYWLLDQNGAVYSFGDAHDYGSLFGSKIAHLRATTLVATPDGGGYLIGTTAGTVYHFGDAPALARTPHTTFHPPAVGMVGVLAAKA
jgi:hypothetical protein